ncbi:hypothetical protein R1sor_000050 [Riccia sorocarpa]|uniref:Uncharacterized protein n=1 Tax=Riccia sorocarpa TaxID=122646 RepID=A0ABD3GSU2_9MARC
MRLVADSPAIAHIEESWPEFARDPRHVRLGLASDGVSTYSIKSSTYSTWPVALMNYNIPQWLATKKGFIILALIIHEVLARTETWIHRQLFEQWTGGKTRGWMSKTGGDNKTSLGLRRWSILHQLPYWKMSHFAIHRWLSNVSMLSAPTMSIGLLSSLTYLESDSL